MSAGPEPATVKDENVRGYARGVRRTGVAIGRGRHMANRTPEFTESGSITRISTDVAGGQANSDSYGPVFSSDGTKVVFYSYASNLVPGDGNGAGDIFVKDLTTGVITRISTDASGAQANGSSYRPVFSPDGTKVAFYSYGSNLVPGDTNGANDIFVKDLTTRVITLVSTDGTDAQGNSSSYGPVFSPDGTKVAFYSLASNLVPNDTNGAIDIFVKDLLSGETIRIATNATGAQGNDYSYQAVFSPDGTKVAFYSYASNLVAGDTNNNADIFIKDLNSGAVTLVSTDAAAIQGNSSSYTPVFSPDGTKVAFTSVATNLVPGDTNGIVDVFVKDLTTGMVTLVTADATGVQADSDSYSPQFSPDGTKLAFYSYATNLVPGDTNNTPDVFVKDLTTGIVTRLSTDAAGAQGNGYSDSPVFSPDGNKVVFNSGAPNLVPDDTNYTTDIFVKDLSVAKATLTDAAAKSALTGAGKIFFADADAGDSHTVSIAPQAGALGALTAVVVPVAGGRAMWTGATASTRR
ncbi:TolB family protein [Xanthobacter wiegelii]|uniref:TolB family protein n=1 Tax=Xanthobacter wiegelii TaxID=3119913 RepID=UPI0037264485